MSINTGIQSNLENQDLSGKSARVLGDERGQSRAHCCHQFLDEFSIASGYAKRSDCPAVVWEKDKLPQRCLGILKIAKSRYRRADTVVLDPDQLALAASRQQLSTPC